MAKLHLRCWNENKTWCGRPLKSVRLARRSTPAEDVCRACENAEEADDVEFKRLAVLIDEAYWQWAKKLLK